MALAGKVCLVTGATRGIGKGVALQLGQSGATVYITGRTHAAKNIPGSLGETAEQVTARGGKCIPVACDHGKDDDVKKLFEKIKAEQNGQLDLLVNNAWAGVQTVFKYWGKKLWETDPVELWDANNNVGLRSHYLCTAYGARLMADRKQGLIVNISSAGGLWYHFSVPYGVGKAALDRMTADSAIELKDINVACVGLWPGPADTEAVGAAFSQSDFKKPEALSELESTEFPGKAIVHLLQDPNVIKKTGRTLLTAELGAEYGFKDINGATPRSLRRVNYMLAFSGYNKLARVVPDWVKVPSWVLTVSANKF